MPDALASQVAAGEVVERPASVVKELIENSIDAGARSIQVDIARGGVGLIKVSDDGDGMCREDAMLAIERHATSKLRAASDLSHLSTYGFRGEALPSIASVARFRLLSCERDALVGTEIIVEGGKLIDVGDAGNASGTQVEIRDLFFNVPARRKFLRAQSTEFGHIEDIVRVSSIVNPAVAFTLCHGGREVLRLAGCDRRIDRITDLFGLDAVEHLVEFNGNDGGNCLQVSGWVSEPGFTRRNRRWQYSFLNGRPIECSAVSSALIESYGGLIERGSFPASFIFIDADPTTVDVNVHPAKREVRFNNSKSLQRLITASVQNAISCNLNDNIAASLSQKPVISLDEQSTYEVDSSNENPACSPHKSSAENNSDNQENQTSLRIENIDRQLEVNLTSAEGASHKILGILDRRYLIMEGNEGLVLIHRRAAHERILYEEALTAIKLNNAPAQALLMPATVNLSSRDFQVVMDNAENLAKFGLRIEVFGENVLKIDALPASCADADPADFLDGVINSLCAGGSKSAHRFSEDQLAVIISHRAARFSESKSNVELDSLVSRLMECDMPYCDARGRPTMIQFSHQELARKFASL